MIRAGALLLALSACGCAPSGETRTGTQAPPAADSGSVAQARRILDVAGLLATLPQFDPPVQTSAEIAASIERFCGAAPGRLRVRSADLLFEPGAGPEEERLLRCISATVLASPALAEHGYGLSIVVASPE